MHRNMQTFKMSLPIKTIPPLSQLSIAQRLKGLSGGDGNFSPAFLHSTIFGGNGTPVCYVSSGRSSGINLVCPPKHRKRDGRQKKPGLRKAKRRRKGTNQEAKQGRKKVIQRQLGEEGN